jgi:hypothetical protein
MMSAQEVKECFICGTPGKPVGLMVARWVEYKCPNCKTEWTTLNIKRVIVAKNGGQGLGKGQNKEVDSEGWWSDEPYRY